MTPLKRRSYYEVEHRFQNREALTITDFKFLSLFKKENEKVYFRLIQEEKHIAKNFDCLLNLDDDLEYPLMQKVIQKDIKSKAMESIL